MGASILGVLGIIGLVILVLYILGVVVSCVVWVKLWRRSMDVNFIAFMLIFMISLTSWVGAVLGGAYLMGGKVLFAKKPPEQNGGGAPLT
jgi:hypothetical protein